METADQMQLPILVELAPVVLRVRPEPLQQAMLTQLREQTGLPMAQICRRCIRLVACEMKRTG